MSRLLRFKRLPLHIHITTLFILLTLSLSAILSGYNYRQSSEMLLSASEDLFDQIGEKIELEFQRSYEPISQAANLIAHTTITETTSLDQRLEQLPLLAKALKQSPEMTALGVSYDSGDFFIVRVMNDDHMRNTFDAPLNSRFQIDHIASQPNIERSIERLFYSDDLQLISRVNAGKTDYDPRVRPWYTGALKNPESAVTDPYLYFFIRKVGITFSRRTANDKAVIAADIALDMLSRSVSGLGLSNNAQLVLLDRNNNVLAYNQPAELIRTASDDKVTMIKLADLPATALQQLGSLEELTSNRFETLLDGETWHGTLRTLTPAENVSFRLLVLLPEEQLLKDAQQVRDRAILISLLIVSLALPIIWLMAHGIAKPLRQLAKQARHIQQFRLDKPIENQSMIKEVDALASTMSLMQNTLAQFIGLMQQIAAEQDFSKLLSLITNETLHSANAEGVILYLVSEDEKLLTAEQFSFRQDNVSSLPTTELQNNCQLVLSLQTNKMGNRPLDGCANPALAALQTQHEQPLRLITIPLRTRKEEPLGVLCLLVADRSDTLERLAMVKTMADFASMTLESRQHETLQKELMKSIIELIAGAIDAKSPYTGGHCQRVPELTEMLVQAACDSQDAPFSNYQLDAQQWEALHIASWLHDCGKVTTPEYVVDKATRLETLYDRIHEIRMRFEVLKRDAHITYWQKYSEGGDPEVLAAERDTTLKTLDDDFNFVAQCNIGDEFISPDKAERLKRIADRCWERTLDDRIGISIEEQQRKALSEPQKLPVREPLLADRYDHLIPFSEQQHQHQKRFNLKPGKYQFNRGELYNLCTQRGTLTQEERHIINDHIVQTILMLEQLPYPKHLRQVPQLAGEHHEKVDGSGYPLGRTGDQMPLSSRAMAIADIFEALTATDRPYKAPKTLSEALKIMSFMRDDQHIDSDLFKLFLTSGVYLKYAEQFLLPDQLDEVDIAPLLNVRVRDTASA